MQKHLHLLVLAFDLAAGLGMERGGRADDGCKTYSRHNKAIYEKIYLRTL